jgi:ABC-2 type transport system ATP-binding protein
MVRVEVGTDDGGLETHEIILDQPETPGEVEALFKGKNVVTIHSEEATLEDIFIRITGKELV